MNAAQIKSRFDELDAKEILTLQEQVEFNNLDNANEMIDQHGEHVYDAAIDVFGADYAATILKDGAYQGCFCTTQEFVEEYLLDSLGLDGVNKNWLDFDGIWDDLERAGSYAVIGHLDRGIFIFETN